MRSNHINRKIVFFNRKIVFFIVLVLVCTFKVYAKRDTCHIDKWVFFENEVARIVDSFLVQQDTRNPTYEVLIARFYHLKDDRSDFSFSISYIENSPEYNEFRPEYYAEINGRYIIMKGIDSVYENLLQPIGIKIAKFSDLNVVAKIIQRLFPIDAGYLLDDGVCASAGSIDGCTVKSTFYRNPSDMSDKVEIFPAFIGEVKDVTDEFRGK